MTRDTVTTHVRMDAGIFRRFGFFDTFVLRRRWVSPAVFSGIFVIFAVICFCLREKAQSTLLGGVLLAVGLLLPACYFLSFYLQMNDQVRRLGIKKPKPVYSLVIGRSDIHITNDMKEEDEVVLPWGNVMGVWRDRRATYIYANAARAFILPDGQSDCSPAELWDFAAQCLPDEKLHGRRP